MKPFDELHPGLQEQICQSLCDIAMTNTEANELLDKSFFIESQAEVTVYYAHGGNDSFIKTIFLVFDGDIKKDHLLAAKQVQHRIHFPDDNQTRWCDEDLSGRVDVNGIWCGQRPKVVENETD